VTPDIEQILGRAQALHQAGRLNEAEGLYRQILALDPNHPDALHLLGVIAYQGGRNDLALELIGKAIARNDRVANFHCNIGNVLGRSAVWAKPRPTTDERSPLIPAILNPTTISATPSRIGASSRRRSGYFGARSRCGPAMPRPTTTSAISSLIRAGPRRRSATTDRRLVSILE
jgi:tetratricopeptide (TPR) repeat protein